MHGYRFKKQRTILENRKILTGNNSEIKPWLTYVDYVFVILEEDINIANNLSNKNRHNIMTSSHFKMKKNVKSIV